MSLPVDVAIKLFNNLVKPVVLYGAEVCGCESYNILERLQLRFCKYMLSVNKYTCSDMIYGELGVTPLSIDVSIRMVVYWAKLVSDNQNKISNIIYSILYKVHDLGIYKSDWINTVRSILNDSGFSGIWLSQTIPLRHNLKIRLRDQFIQKCHEGISQSRKCTSYRVLKNIFGFEKYLIELPEELRKSPITYWDRMPWKCTTGHAYMSTLSQRHNYSNYSWILYLDVCMCIYIYLNKLYM